MQSILLKANISNNIPSAFPWGVIYRGPKASKFGSRHGILNLTAENSEHRQEKASLKNLDGERGHVIRLEQILYNINSISK
jgi:hypothetical protein